MTGYAVLMQATREFDDMVEAAVAWVFENEAELTENGASADVLNDQFVDKLREICDGDQDTIEAVRGEAAVSLECQAAFAVTRDWAGQWA